MIESNKIPSTPAGIDEMAILKNNDHFSFEKKL
jgi:hypothetical protein